MRKAAYLLIGLGVLLLDQVTKVMVTDRLLFGEAHHVTSWFSIVHWQNRGGVWGTFQNLSTPLATAIFMILPLAGVGILVFLFLRSERALDRALFSMILGGAAGNLMDRFRLGAVIDFLDFHLPEGPSWPAFNVADAALSTGIVVLLFITLRRPPTEHKNAPDPFPHR
jgi:signal peptidase II